MNRRLLALLASLSGPLLAGCFGSPDGGGTPTDDPTAKPECQLNSKNEKSPGFPYDVAKFRSDVLPLALSSCGSSSCHGSATGVGGFQLWPNAAKDNCDFGKSFNAIVAKIDLTDTAKSRFLLAPTGDAAHPVIFPAGDAKLVTLKAFADAAKAADTTPPTTQPPVGAANPFDANVFKTQIQPALDSVTCGRAGCHANGVGGFTFKGNATAQADLDANFLAVTARADLNNIQQSKIYFRAVTAHSGSTAVSAQNGQKILDFITAAKNNAPTNGNTGCAPITKFNQSLFRSEIVPILTGQVDYNRADQQGNGIGCASGACHGTDHGPGSFVLVKTDDPAKQLANFACFVDLASPATSEILDCPLDGGNTCRRKQHPGGNYFQDANDLNYQKLLAFLYGSQVAASPNDFAFFVRKINPIFDDENAVQNGDLNLRCSSGQCHGTNVPGGTPGNGSDFGILPGVSDLTALSTNFVSATGFINFLNPSQSSLFLYPTNEIANRNNPFATGIAHPGGPDFAVNSTQALDILKWATGLRPNAQGFLLDWLVAGDYAASLITDTPLLDERNVSPKIFDASGGSFNLAVWDAFFSPSQNVNLNVPFPAAATAGRIGYAVNYFINAEARDQDVNLTFNSANAYTVYVDGRLATQADNGGQSNVFFTMPPVGGKPVKVMIKVFQRANDATFAFSAQAKDELGNLLTDATGEVVLTLAPNGGI